MPVRKVSPGVYGWRCRECGTEGPTDYIGARAATDALYAHWLSPECRPIRSRVVVGHPAG